MNLVHRVEWRGESLYLELTPKARVDGFGIGLVVLAVLLAMAVLGGVMPVDQARASTIPPQPACTGGSTLEEEPGEPFYDPEIGHFEYLDQPRSSGDVFETHREERERVGVPLVRVLGALGVLLLATFVVALRRARAFEPVRASIRPGQWVLEGHGLGAVRSVWVEDGRLSVCCHRGRTWRSRPLEPLPRTLLDDLQRALTPPEAEAEERLAREALARFLS